MAWTDAAHELDAELPGNSRAVVLPGQLFATYRWGTTVDPILPALSSRPVAVRNVVPYADLRAVDMLWTTDALLQQERLLPGQLTPLLQFLGAGALVAGSDDVRARSGAIAPAAAAALLATQAGFERPARAYGAVRPFHGETGTLDPTRRLPQVARYDVPGGPGIVRVQPAGAGDARRRLGGDACRPRGVRRARRGPPLGLRRRSHHGRAARGGSSGSRTRRRGRQPPAAGGRVAHAAGCRCDARGRRGAPAGRRDPRPAGGRDHRTDGGRPRRRARPARRPAPGRGAVPRAPSVRRSRRLDGDRLDRPQPRRRRAPLDGSRPGRAA